MNVGEPHPSKQGLKLCTRKDVEYLLTGRRAPSIKTRIETVGALEGGALKVRVGEPHPSKQGLKHKHIAEELEGRVPVGEPHPSKQGLKPEPSGFFGPASGIVGEPHPSKQGLKLSIAPDIVQLCPSRRAPSIKTRIETGVEYSLFRYGVKSASPIHQNKD